MQESGLTEIVHSICTLTIRACISPAFLHQEPLRCTDGVAEVAEGLAVGRVLLLS